MGLLSKISSYFVKKPPPVTGMAALTAKRISPMPPPEVKTKSKKAPGALTDVDDIMQYCLYGLVLIVGGCSIFSLISSSHYGSESRKRTASNEHNTEQFNGGAPASTSQTSHRLKSWL